jgi:hypothetical protein
MSDDMRKTAPSVCAHLQTVLDEVVKDYKIAKVSLLNFELQDISLLKVALHHHIFVIFITDHHCL